MTSEQQIDAALDSVLRASGSALKYYTMPKVLDEMRAAMRKVMSDSYIDGLNDMFRIAGAGSTQTEPGDILTLAEASEKT